MRIQWRPVLTAFAISVGIAALIGVAWGILGFAAFLVAEDAAERFYESPVAAVAGFVLGYVPDVVGAVYLTMAVTCYPYKHATILGVMNAALSLLLVVLFPEGQTSAASVISDVFYSLLAVPIALLSCWITLRAVEAR